MKIDMLASKPHYVDHLRPIWLALPPTIRGTFYESGPVSPSDNVVVQCSYGDLSHLLRQKWRGPIVMLEHGTGHAFGTSAYPNGPGRRDAVSLFLAPNEYTKRIINGVRKTRVEVIGVPKLDQLVHELNLSHFIVDKPSNPEPVVAVGFHWGTSRIKPPESGSALEHYLSMLPALRNKYHMIGYGHPLAQDEHIKVFDKVGIPYVSNFRDIMTSADVLINDLSSVMYEFLVTGKPVIILNAPWFRRHINHGLRFWDYSDIGPQVDEPSDLIPTVERVLLGYGQVCVGPRMRAIHDLFPHLGSASQKAAHILEELINGHN